MAMAVLDQSMAMLELAAPLELRGTVTRVQGLALRVIDLPVPIGAMVRIDTKRGRGPAVDGEVVGFDEDQAIVMPLGSTAGMGRGDQVTAGQHSATVGVGDSLL